MSSLFGNVNFVNNYGFSNLYSGTSSLFGAKSSSSTSSTSSMYNLLSMQYGVNNAAKSSTTTATSSTVRDYGNSLSTIMSSLRAKGSSSLFNQIGASSSNSSIASATVDNKTFNESKNSPVELNVKQIAKAQTNTGSALKTDSKAVNSGTYDFAIEVGGKKQKFSVSVTAADTNESIQKKMASAINSKGIGVTASVSSDANAKTSKLSLTATGTNNSFSITDTRGSLVSKMGVDKISQNAQDAVYSVNGVETTSQTNNVDLGNGVTATLKEAGKTTLTFQRDGSGSIDKVKELVNTLNGIVGEALNSEGRGTDRLGQAITSMNKAYKGTLEKAGINVSSGGLLSVDEDKLKKAAENGSLEKLFQGNGNYGFAARTERIAKNMSETNIYANQVQSTSNTYDFSSLYNYSGTYNYNNYSSVGSLLDSLF